MKLTLTNQQSDIEPVMSEDEGGWAEALAPNTPLTVDRPGTDVLIIGDKPSVLDGILAVPKALAQPVIDLLNRLVGARPTGGAPAPETLEVAIENGGPNGIRVLLGDGVTEYTVAPGQTYVAAATGFLELRELGLAPAEQAAPKEAP